MDRNVMSYPKAMFDRCAATVEHMTEGEERAVDALIADIIGDIALVFVFAVGCEIELGTLRRHGRVVPLVALGALFVPMGLGIACVLLLRPEFTSIGITSARSWPA